MIELTQDQQSIVLAICALIAVVMIIVSYKMIKESEDE